jgi:hypothetical protein
MTPRLALIFAVFFFGVVGTAQAQEFDRATRKKATRPTEEDEAVPTIRDDSRYLNETVKAASNKSIANLFRRYQCRVLVEIYTKEPSDWAGRADLDDAEAVKSVVTRMGIERMKEAKEKDASRPIVVFIQGPSYLSWDVWVPNRQQDQAQLHGAIRDRFVSNKRNFSWALPDILSATERICQGKSAEKIAPVVAEFRNTVTGAGLSEADLNALLDARGEVPYDDLAAFANDEINDGRKGSDLKDDLLTFIKLFKEKK